MRKNILLIAILFITTIGVGQNIQPPKEIKSPNAASLGKYGDLPINYYTGRTNITIPVYSTERDGVPLDISLSYDTGGIRVNELPSWIGQNWSLNAGGVITRTMKGGLPDEYLYNLYDYEINSIKGYYFSKTLLQSSSWSSNNNLTNITSNPVKSDYEPDIFNFNFMGFTGKFFLDQNGKWCVQSKQNLKVEINFNDNLYILNRNIIYLFDPGLPQANWQKCIAKIKITDENGNKYTFGGIQEAIEYSQNNFFNFRGDVSANAWYLTKVENRHNDLLYSFSYQRGEFQAHFYPYYLSKTRSLSSGVGSCSYSESTPMEQVAGTLTIPSYLTQITVYNDTNITINFNKSLSNYKAFSISTNDNLILRNTIEDWKLTNNYNTGNSSVVQSKFYLFYHDQNEQNINTGSTIELGEFLLSNIKNYKLNEISIYYGNNLFSSITMERSGNTDERLNLNGLTFKTLSNNKVSTYKFQYNNFNLLPSLLSKKTDHWGYYNGKDYNMNTPNFFSSFYALKEPDFVFSQIGSLMKIFYPTGGFTEFEYEPHSYSQFVQDDLTLSNQVAIPTIAGGLRVKKIKNFNGQQFFTKEIKYTSSPNSSQSSGILAFKNKYYVPNWLINGVGYVSTYNESVFSLNNLIPLSNFSGSHVAYSRVYEIENGKGYKEFQYTDYTDYPDVPYTNTISLSHSIFDEHIRNDFKRGLEKKISYFNSDNIKVKEEISIYNSTGNYKSRAFNYDQFQPCSGIGAGVYIGNAYEVEYSDFNLFQKVNTDFFGTNNVSVTTNYGHVLYPNDTNNYGNSFIKSVSTIVNNENNTITYNYPFDFSNSVDNAMISQHFFPVEETIISKNSQDISKEKVNYAFFSSALLPSNTQKSKGSSPYEIDITYDSYDVKKRLTQYRKNNIFPTVLYWNNSNLTKKVEGATIADISIYGLNKYLSTTYDYNQFNQLIKITYPNGLFENYFYDSANRLEKITDLSGNVTKKIEYNLSGTN